MKAVIFSGTTEGRKLSGMLDAAGIPHTVCVATEYGSEVMPYEASATVRVGRMDEVRMEEYLAGEGFEKGDIIVDATHPYAKDVSANIRAAADKLSCRLIRISRAADPGCIAGEGDDLRFYGSIEEFAHFADGCEGNILLTTGSGTLDRYCKAVSEQTLLRTYVRVLPAIESLKICEDLGIEKSRIVAMQGPFSHEMNRAILLQYGISHMLTKDSGAAGGFAEKISAAKELGIKVHVISRPEGECTEGVDIYNAYKTITGCEFRPKRNIVLAGAGMGPETLTRQTADAIARADAVFGAASVIKSINAAKKFDMYLAKDIINALESEPDIVDAVVLFSGDTGFYSGAKKAAAEFEAWDQCESVTIYPGISSISCLAAKLGVSYDDAVITSIHGRNSLHNIENLTDTIIENHKTYVLLSGDEDLRAVARKLADRGGDPVIHAGRNLCLEDESVRTLSVAEAFEYKDGGTITVLFINNDR